MARQISWAATAGQQRYRAAAFFGLTPSLDLPTVLDAQANFGALTEARACEPASWMTRWFHGVDAAEDVHGVGLEGGSERRVAVLTFDCYKRSCRWTRASTRTDTGSSPPRVRRSEQSN